MGWSADQLEKSVPPNQPIQTLATGLLEAWKAFGQPTAWILVVVEESNQNQPDQRFVEFAVEELSHGQVRFIRLTFAQCDERLSLAVGSRGAGQALLVDGEKMVGVVYFRAGYSPTHFPTAREWSARLLIERSSAIKCPSVGLLLANTKKVQQVLSDRTVLGRFFRDDCEDERGLADAVHSTFARMWGFGGGMREEEAVTMNKAIANPHRFVLKPNREGGGGNYRVTRKSGANDTRFS
jgi:glutathione synthase